MNEATTTVELLLKESTLEEPIPEEPTSEESTPENEVTILAPDTGEFSKVKSDFAPGFGISLFFFVACVIVIVGQIARLLYEKKNKTFSISNDKAIKKTIISCSVIIMCCVLGGLSVKNFSKLANAANGEQAIALASSGSVNINARVGDFAYACDSLNITTKTPAGYKVYARVLPEDSSNFFYGQDGVFSWTNNGKLAENNVGYVLKSNDISADTNDWGSLSGTWKVIKEYTDATDGNNFKTEVCYGINSDNNDDAGEYLMKVHYYAAAKNVDYVLEYDANGGSSAPSQQKYENTIEPSHTFTVAGDAPVREDYIFLGWSTAPDGDVQYRGGDSLNTDKLLNKLYAVWAEDSPVIEYSFPNDGRYIFVNNNESLEDYMYFADSDKGNSLLYSAVKIKDEDMSIENEDERRKDAYSGAIEAGVPTEIYWDHLMSLAIRTSSYDNQEKRYKNDDDNKLHYAIRLYNPSDSEAIVSFGNCGSTVLHYTEPTDPRRTFEQYYTDGCKLKGTEVRIGPRQSGIIKPTWNDNNEEDSTGKKWDLEFFLNPDAATITAQTSLDDHFDGIVSLESSKFLFISVFAFTDYSKTLDATYGGNYTNGHKQYSGYFDKAPVTRQNATYYITDDTPSGALKTRYLGVDGEIHSNDDGAWYTNNKLPKEGNLLGGDYATLKVPVDLGDGRGLHYITMGAYYNGFEDERYPGTAFNWGNWGIHYEDEITIKNLSSESKTVAFVISAARDAKMVAYSNGNARLLEYNDSWSSYTDNEVLEVEVPAGEERTMTADSTLCGMSTSLIKRKVVLK